MRLQSKDYIAANQIQMELSQMVPGDATIQAFASYLPAEAEWQEAVLQEEADAQGEESEYDDEEVSEEEEASDQEPEEAAEATDANQTDG